jgi:hypothetical protein
MAASGTEILDALAEGSMPLESAGDSMGDLAGDFTAASVEGSTAAVDSTGVVGSMVAAGDPMAAIGNRLKI